jgi:polyisoprenoid-binding protein YceI
VRRRRLVIVAVIVALLALGGVGAAYAYFFSGLRTAPRPLALASASASPSAPSSSSPAAPTDLTGRWTVADGSQAGYRVREQFVGQAGPHEAVARTSAVSGGFTVEQGPAGLRATGVRIVADLGQLHSVDQVAGRDVTQRDRFVSRSLSVQQYPQAVFQGEVADLPGALASGTQAGLDVPGQLTIHGTTRDTTAAVRLQAAGGRGQAAGSISIDMRDFGVVPPEVPFTKSEAQVTIEFQLALARAA